MPIAKSVIDVMLGEAGYAGTDAITYADMMCIASVINNRAIALGVTPEDVVSAVAKNGTKQFDAYGKALPGGVSAYRDLAEEAWSDVQTNGSITPATFYATPKAAKNLPSGLVSVASVPKGHQYFTDPYNRAINTKLGYREPVDIATVNAMAAQRVQADFQGGVPTPEQRPNTINVPTQNPALMSGVPVAQQVDPNFGTGVPAISSLTAPVDLATAQTMQPAASRFAADQALQAAMKSKATPDIMDRFTTHAAPARAFDNIATAGIEPGIAETIANSGVPARAVQTTAISPGNADAAPAQASDLGSFPGGMAAQRTSLATEPTAKSDRIISSATPASFDPSRMAPAFDVAASSLSDGMKAARDINEALSVPATASVQTTPGMEAAATANLGINSAQHKEVQDAANAALDKAMAEQQAAVVAANPALATPNFNQALNPTVPDLMTAGATTITPDPNAVLFAAPAQSPSLTPEQEAAQFAEEVASQKTSRIASEDSYRMGVTTGTQPLETVQVADQPTIAAAEEDVSVPALEQVTIPDQPTIADPNAALMSPSVPAMSNQMQQVAAQATQRGPSAMDVWGGKATAGTATDGSTVSRMDDGRIGRYVPEFNYTVFSDDEGTHWSAPKTGNLLTQAAAPTTTQPTTTATQADPNKALTSPTISAPQTAGQKMADSIFSGGTAGALMGTVAGSALLGPVGGIIGGLLGNKIGGTTLGDGVPDKSPFRTLIDILAGINSPTGVAPAGSVGGMTVGRDGPAGAGGGWGPGGSPSNPGSAGGYGTTSGQDPDGTY